MGFLRRRQPQASVPAPTLTPTRAILPEPVPVDAPSAPEPWDGLEAITLYIPTVDLWRVEAHTGYILPADPERSGTRCIIPDLDRSVLEMDEEAFEDRLDALHALGDLIEDEIAMLERRQQDTEREIAPLEAAQGGPSIRLRI